MHAILWTLLRLTSPLPFYLFYLHGNAKFSEQSDYKPKESCMARENLTRHSAPMARAMFSADLGTASCAIWIIVCMIKVEKI